MPKLTVNGDTFDVEPGKRLVLAIEDTGVKIGHRCGGYAHCTTCRVDFVEGEPNTMTRAEFDKLSDASLMGEVRLSCQIVCDHDMSVRPIFTLDKKPEWEGDTGPRPKEIVTPEAKWFLIETLEKEEV